MTIVETVEYFHECSIYFFFTSLILLSMLLGDTEQRSTCRRWICEYSHRMVSCEMGRLLGWPVDGALRSFVVDTLDPGATCTQTHTNTHFFQRLCAEKREGFVEILSS